MKIKGNHGNRPPGHSSRTRRGDGPKSEWIAPNKQAVPLPLIVDNVYIDPTSGVCVWCIEAKIDLVGDSPELIELHLEGDPCLDPIRLQRFFRWATPIEIARVTVPGLLEQGIDPFQHEFATDGYPDAANIDRKPTTRLSDEFLQEIARQYVEVGHGYARAIAQQRGVSRRTVISWVEKARKRGFLGPTKPGRRNRRVVSAGQRKNIE